MGDNTKIEWADASWNPLRVRSKDNGRIGWHCEHVTTGCEFCYAEGFNLRFGTRLPFKPGHRKDIRFVLDDRLLTQPLRWKRPRMVFVCSMTDLFADFVEDAWIDSVFAVMTVAQQHTFQVLTKRPERMRRYLTVRWSLGEKLFPNVWLGVSAERQEEADERIPHLLGTPAAVRFVSAEPLLGPIDLMRGALPMLKPVPGLGWAGLDWVIVGGESGSSARPMRPDWARSLRDQCVAAGVPFFFKQFGEYAPQQAINEPPHFAGGEGIVRVGKIAAGRQLDGREWNQFPSR
jgi:protein gp37